MTDPRKEAEALCEVCGRPNGWTVWIATAQTNQLTKKGHPAPRRRHMTEIIEEVAAKVHEQWMQSKREKGVTSRKSETGEELMVPYPDLSEAAKELDRGSVRATVIALKLMGYSILRGAELKPLE